MVHETSMVDKGALAGLWSELLPRAGRRAAKLVVKILQGARPADIPIQDNRIRLSLAINLRTARAINLALPRSILERVDHFVE